MWGCSETPTETEEGITISGTVTLEGETDHSGVTISLYKPIELDTALVRINQEYPNIGVQISQETEFDHRDYTPIKSTISNSSGNWSITIEKDDGFFIVAEKEKFGWMYNLNTDEKKNVNFELKNIIEINASNIFNDYIFESGRHYVISGLTTFNNINIIMEKNCVIRINEATSIRAKQL